MMYDVKRVREDFPILTREIYGRPLVYLDNGATTQKPRQVVEAMVDEYYNVNANVHRGVHFLSQQATDLHEALLAFSFGEAMVREGDEVVVSAMEHHSNIVPWQMMCERKGAQLRVIPMTDDGELQLEALEGLLNEKTRIVCCTQVSNVLGTVNPVKEVVRMAHEKDIPVLIDGAQSVPHMT